MDEEPRPNPGAEERAPDDGDGSRGREQLSDRPPGRSTARERQPAWVAERPDERAGASEAAWTENAVGRWIALSGERSAIVLVLTLVVFVGFLGLGAAGIVDVTDERLVSTVFSASITGVFTLVTITVSINQLVLSRIIGSPRQLRRRIDSVDEFRGDLAAENVRTPVAPTEPAAFLSVVTGALRESALRVGDVYDRRHDPRRRRDVEDLVDELVDLTDRIDGRIESRRLRLIHVLLPILNNRYSRYVHVVDLVMATTDDLASAERVALGELRSVLQDINLTRHYFKTLYLHEALASLSTLMLVTGVPAVLLSYVVILSYGDGSWIGGPARTIAVSAGIAIVLVPLSVLFAYGIRVATIASRTTTFGTFTPIEELP